MIQRANYTTSIAFLTRIIYIAYIVIMCILREIRYHVMNKLEEYIKSFIKLHNHNGNLLSLSENPNDPYVLHDTVLFTPVTTSKDHVISNLHNLPLSSERFLSIACFCDFSQYTTIDPLLHEISRITQYGAVIIIIINYTINRSLSNKSLNVIISNCCKLDFIITDTQKFFNTNYEKMIPTILADTLPFPQYKTITIKKEKINPIINPSKEMISPLNYPDLESAA